jgi:hypothetical protein
MFGVLSFHLLRRTFFVIRHTCRHLRGGKTGKSYVMDQLKEFKGDRDAPDTEQAAASGGAEDTPAPNTTASLDVVATELS